MNDVIRLKERFAAIQIAMSGNRVRAKAAITARTEFIGPLKVLVTAGSGHQCNADEPVALGGGNEAASPIEYALVALSSCQAVTYRVWAAQLDIKLDSVSVVVSCDVDLKSFFGLGDERRAFSGVRILVTLVGPEEKERYRELAETVDSRCPVLDLFRNEVTARREISVISRI